MNGAERALADERGEEGEAEVTIIEQIQALDAEARELNRKFGEVEQKLTEYESRKVPLTKDDLERIFSQADEELGEALLVVARAALAASESPAAVKAALSAWSSGRHVGTLDGVRDAIRAAHDAAIEGGCGDARKQDDPSWLADAAEALGLVTFDGKPLALNWTQVVSEIRVMKSRFNAEVEHHKRIVGDRDKWLDAAKQLEKEHDRLSGEIEGLRYERDNVRGQLDALTKPIDGIDELGRIGWYAWQRADTDNNCRAYPRADDDHAEVACDNANAQAIASSVIGALRSAFAARCDDEIGGRTVESLSRFDAAVASLKILPEPTECKSDDSKQVEAWPIRDRIRELEERLEKLEAVK
jgi:prefoldin subunit 5